MLQNLCVDDRVKCSARYRQVVRRSDVIGAARSRMNRMLPISGPIVHLSEQLRIRRFAGANVKDARTRLQLARYLQHEGENRAALPWIVGDKRLEFRRRLQSRHVRGDHAPGGWATQVG